jgi:hypothetical protein
MRVWWVYFFFSVERRRKGSNSIHFSLGFSTQTISCQWYQPISQRSTLRQIFFSSKERKKEKIKRSKKKHQIIKDKANKIHNHFKSRPKDSFVQGGDGLRRLDLEEEEVEEFEGRRIDSI